MDHCYGLREVNIIDEAKNKIAFVSAAGRGIGKAIAKGLAAEGATVVVNSYSEETASSTADDIKKRGESSINARRRNRP